MITDVIIPMGGNGKRMSSLSKNINKSMIAFGNKTIIEQILDTLINTSIENAYLIIRGEDNFVSLIGYKYNNIKLHYIIQEKPKGLANAILKVKNQKLNKKFLLLLSDTIFDKITIDSLLNFKCFDDELVVLIKKNFDDLSSFGLGVISNDNYLERIIGVGCSENISQYIITGAYLLNNNIFELIEKLDNKSIEEVDFNSVLNFFAKKKKVKYLIDNNDYYDLGTLDRYQYAIKRYLNKKM